MEWCNGRVYVQERQQGGGGRRGGAEHGDHVASEFIIQIWLTIKRYKYSWKQMYNAIRTFVEQQNKLGGIRDLKEE